MALIYLGAWMSASIGMILFNKAVLSTFNFPFPMFLTAWHMLVATVATHMLARHSATSYLLPAVQQQKMTFEMYISRILPIAFLYASSLICSNTAYVYLSISFVQMLKATTPVLVLLVSFAAGIEKHSLVYFHIITLICLGVMLASMGELRFNTFGATFQAIACICEGVRLVLANFMLRDINLDALSYLYYTAPVCGAVIAVLCFVIEGPYIHTPMLTQVFPVVLLTNGIVAFSLNLTGALLIKNTSALTLTLAGIVKDILLCFCSVTVFGAPITTLQIVGYALAIVGLNAYKEYRRYTSEFDQVGLAVGLWRVITNRVHKFPAESETLIK